MVPNFYIPGAQKCGTTTLYGWLKAHPQCLMTVEKEPHVLATEDSPRDRYQALWGDGVGLDGIRAAGDASTSYLVVPGVPERIAGEFGIDARFVILLRDPVDRVCSSYLHMFKRGHETRDWNDLFRVSGTELDAAVAAESAECGRAESDGRLMVAPYRTRFGEQSLWPFRYLYGTLYSRHAERFIRVFGRDRCHFAFLENLRHDPRTELKAIYEFLGLDGSFVPRDIGIVRNRTVMTLPCPPLDVRIRQGLHEIFDEERSRLAAIVDSIPAEWERPRSCAA